MLLQVNTKKRHFIAVLMVLLGLNLSYPVASQYWPNPCQAEDIAGMGGGRGGLLESPPKWSGKV
jgi:hypothetical protein